MEPKFMMITEQYELDNKSQVNVEVELAYNRDKGLHVAYVNWMDGKNDLICFTGLPWHEQVYLINDLEKTIKRHCESYFEKAFAYFELNELR